MLTHVTHDLLVTLLTTFWVAAQIVDPSTLATFVTSALRSMFDGRSSGSYNSLPVVKDNKKVVIMQNVTIRTNNGSINLEF